MNDTLAELKNILSDIAEKTGTVVRLEPHGGRETRFTLDFYGVAVDAWIDGDGKTAEETAALLRYFVSNADMLRPLPDREDYLRSILLGEAGSWYLYRFMSKYKISAGACFAICIREEKRLAETVAHIERCIADTRDMVVRMDDETCALIKFCENGQSDVEFARFIAQSVYEEIGVKPLFGVGGEAGSFTEITTSYQQATTAVRMSALFRSRGEVHSYREFLLVRMLEEVSEARLKDFMKQFRVEEAAEIFEDEDMLGTAEEFLENSLNVSETSRNLYMHRNTLTYRLDKIERVTGLNIRKFSDAVSFRVISILYKLIRT